MIVVFTAVHGAFETAQHTIAAIDRSCPAPYMHLIGDDFSPEPDHSHYMSLPSIPHPQCLRAVYECSELGSDGGPSMGLSLGYVWSFARVLRAEALWVVESDVVPQQDIVTFFRQAPEFYGDGPIGAIAPLYTGGGSALTTYGGKDLVEVQDFPERLGIAPGDNIVKSDTLAHTVARVTWAHLACLWIPLSTLDDERIFPDPNFGLWFLDHDLSNQLDRNGLHMIVSNKCVADHPRAAASTGVRWPDGAIRTEAEVAGRCQLYGKWGR